VPVPTSWQWFAWYDADDRDNQIGSDAKSGKLTRLVERAPRDHEAREHHGSRTHLGRAKQRPFPRQFSGIGRIIVILQLGGLHHRMNASQRNDMPGTQFWRMTAILNTSGFSESGRLERNLQQRREQEMCASGVQRVVARM
jgi:hypothetical protein